MPHAARIAPGRPGSQHGLAFEKQDIAEAVAREMVSGACAHAPAADYDHVCCSLRDEATIYITVVWLRKGRLGKGRRFSFFTHNPPVSES